MPSGWAVGGQTMPPQYLTRQHEVDYKAAGLPPPHMGRRWYAMDGSYVLADPTVGLIWKTLPAPQPLAQRSDRRWDRAEAP